MNKYFLLFIIIVICSCGERPGSTSKVAGNYVDISGNFGSDYRFLKKYHSDLVLLGADSTGPQIIVLPAYQGRVMTSTAEGFQGSSFGWVNRELIAGGKITPHINVFGGEERFWLGPEGGQFSIYFKKGVAFTLDNWFVPKELDTEPFRLISSSSTMAAFEKDMHLENFSGNKLDLNVKRRIRLLEKKDIDSVLGMNLSADVKSVGFESSNIITNTGEKPWDKNTGMLSIWILSMLNASDKTTVAVPYKQGDTSKMGKIVTDDYFGKVPESRLRLKNGYLLFKADAAYRSKIGIAPGRALPFLVSYDPAAGVLSIAQFSLHEGISEYVNSLWKLQDKPFQGDAVNAYNDGPVNGKQLGKFYEVESSSPAAALKPGEEMVHFHRTIHLKGPAGSLNKISMKLLGIDVQDITL